MAQGDILRQKTREHGPRAVHPRHAAPQAPEDEDAYRGVDDNGHEGAEERGHRGRVGGGLAEGAAGGVLARGADPGVIFFADVLGESVGTDPRRELDGQRGAGSGRVDIGRHIPGLSPAAATARSLSHPSGRARRDQGIQISLSKIRAVWMILETVGDVGGEVESWMARREVELRSADLGGKTGVRGSWVVAGPQGTVRECDRGPGVRRPGDRQHHPSDTVAPSPGPSRVASLHSAPSECHSGMPPRPAVSPHRTRKSKFTTRQTAIRAGITSTQTRIRKGRPVPPALGRQRRRGSR